MTFKESANKDNQSVEASNTTPDEILELKKKLAEEFVDKLSEKDSDSMDPFTKLAIKKYLVDENNPIDTFFDEVIRWELLPQDIKKYREMFCAANTKDQLENLRKDIFNEIWWTEQVSTTTQKSDTSTEASDTPAKSSDAPTESSDTVDNNWIVEKACQIAVDIANDNSYWYEWGWTGYKDGKKWFDCQGFVRHCYIKTWINVPPSWWCANMKKDFEKVWFECITFNKNEKLKPWDILVANGHTEMCVWENKIAWAHSNKDKKAWDSGWEEISVRSVKSSLSYWDPQFILRYKWDSA